MMVRRPRTGMTLKERVPRILVSEDEYGDDALEGYDHTLPVSNS
jgi:hypothetical protein